MNMVSIIPACTDRLALRNGPRLPLPSMEGTTYFVSIYLTVYLLKRNYFSQRDCREHLCESIWYPQWF